MIKTKEEIQGQIDILNSIFEAFPGIIDDCCSTDDLFEQYFSTIVNLKKQLETTISLEKIITTAFNAAREKAEFIPFLPIGKIKYEQVEDYLKTLNNEIN